ncbi:MAG: sensor domain-containing diguanylate cyclase, partial [Leptospiraceae bacterium]|nr:sensor domain-containing diguanylate cyclase [Leptospiraceae bacterium]
MLRKTEESFVSAEITELMENYEKKIYDLRQLMEITKALNSNLDYNSLIDAILNSCLAQLQTMKAAIFLAPDVDSDHLKLEAGARSFDFSDVEMDLKIYNESTLMQLFSDKHKTFFLKEFGTHEPSLGSDEMFKLLKKKGVEVHS